MEKMLEKTAEELEIECLRLLRANASTRESVSVPIRRVRPYGDGPNWTWGAIDPPLPPIAKKDADRIISEICGRLALKD